MSQDMGRTHGRLQPELRLRHADPRERRLRRTGRSVGQFAGEWRRGRLCQLARGPLRRHPQSQRPEPVCQRRRRSPARSSAGRSPRSPRAGRSRSIAPRPASSPPPESWTTGRSSTAGAIRSRSPSTPAAGRPAARSRRISGGPRSQLLDPTGKVLASATSTTAGAILKLTNVALPADGTYTIAVQAAAGHTSSVGNYVVAAYDVTPLVQPLNVNQVITGDLTTPYSTDQWTFSASANTQVKFLLQAESATGLNFSLTGPNGFTGFSKHHRQLGARHAADRGDLHPDRPGDGRGHRQLRVRGGPDEPDDAHPRDAVQRDLCRQRPAATVRGQRADRGPAARSS